MATRKELLYEELLGKFDGDLPNHLTEMFGEFDESELELFLEDAYVPFRENHHHKSYMKDLKNNEYYIKLLEDYEKGEELTDKQVRTAQLVDKILKKTGDHPDYYEEDYEKLPQEEQIALNQKIRRKTHETLGVYKGMDASDAINLATEEDATLPKKTNTFE